MNPYGINFPQRGPSVLGSHDKPLHGIQIEEIGDGSHPATILGFSPFFLVVVAVAVWFFMKK